MAYTLYTLAANPKYCYSGSRKASAIRYIALHYTANSTDTAYANANYFSVNGTNVRKAGAHFFVDATTVYASVGELYSANAVGGSKYSDCSTTGGGTLYGTVTNSNSISIEMCSTNGKIADATVENAVALTKTLMAKYDIPASRVVRHFDVTGKHCPGWTGWYGSNSTLWTAFKAKLTATTTTTTTEKTEDEDDMTEAEVKKIMKSYFADCMADYEEGVSEKDVSSWAKVAFEAATEAGILDGTSPQSNVNRQMLAQVLLNLGFIGTGTSSSSSSSTSTVEYETVKINTEKTSE